MRSGPNHDDIMSALHTSGYLMEQEVATQLESLDFHVQTNRAFEDQEEGKSREIDVQAIKRIAHNEEKRLSAFVELLVECKNSKNPFVFIGRPKNDSDNRRKPFEYCFPLTRYESRKDLGGGRGQIRNHEGFFHFGFDQVHYDFKKSTKAVQFCRIDRKGKSWSANHGGLYDSIFYPIAKAVAARKGEIPKSTREDDWKYFWFFIPLVVVSGEIFYVESTEVNPAPEERDYITFKREIRSQKLNDTFSVDFVRQKSLKTFVSTCLNPIIERAVDLTMNHADFVLNSVVPWED